MIITDKIQQLREWFERLSQRERALIGAMGVTFVITVTLIIGFFINDGLTSLAERNADMRQALRDIDTQRESYLRAKAKVDQMATRLGQQPIQLGGYLEAAAKETGVQIPESNDRPPVAAGKNWMEKSVDLHLTRVKLDQLANFLKHIESGPQLVVVTGLLVRTRDDKHQELDVDLTVSTFEKASKDKAGGKKGEKEKG
jgi:general secretion pathway protein M